MSESDYKLFCYGTLEIPEIMRAVTGANFDCQPAVLPNYARFQVRQAEYPGIVAEPDSETVGTLFTGIDEKTIEMLDAYEGDLYERANVMVQTREGGEVEAVAYVVPDRNKHHLTRQPWNRGAFRQQHYSQYLKELV